jgi:hypothetical protein
MSKIYLRKLIALGAVAALGVTGFVGIAPANAVTLTNTAATVTYNGTGLKIVEGTDFSATVAIAASHAYWSQTAANTFGYTSSVVYRYVYQDWIDQGNDDDGFWSGSERIVYSTDDLSVLTSPNDATTSGEYIRSRTNVSTATAVVWEATGSGLVSGTTSATLYAGAMTADTDITYTPFIETDPIGVDNANGTRDAWEVQAPALTITFADYVAANWVTTLSTGVRNGAGEDSALVTGKLTPAGTGWNLTQISDDVYMELFRNGASDETDTSLTVATASLDANFGGANQPTGVFTAKSFIDNSATTIDNSAGTTADFQLGAESAPVSVEYLASDARIDDITIDGQATNNITTSDVIRSGITTVTITATLRDENGSPVAKAGEKVEFMVNPDVDMTFNGVAVKAADATTSVWATTNASGVASLTVVNATAKAGNDFSVDAYYYTDTRENSNYEYDYEEYDWEDAYVWGFHEQSWYNQINSVKGQTLTFNYSVTDQFGAPYSGADAKIYVDNDVDNLPTVQIAVSNGKATYTTTEAFSTGTTYTITAELYTRDTPTGNTWSYAGFDSDHLVTVVANNTVGILDTKVYDTDGDNSTRSDFDFDVNYDEFDTNNFWLNNNTFFDGLDTNGYDFVEVTGRVTNSAGVELIGARVELKGKGQFWTFGPGVLSGRSGIYSEDSITVFTDSDGYYMAYFATHKSGSNTVTSSSGGKSGSVTFTADRPSDSNADSLMITAPKSVKGGRTFTATVSVVDMWGNIVAADDIEDQQLSASSNRGLLVVNSPAENDFEATYQVKVMLQSLDRGPVLVDLNWYSDNEDADFGLSDSFAVWSGPAVNATAGAKKGRVIVEAYRSVGQTVNVFVGSTKVASFVPDAANDKFVVKGIKSGNRKVSVKVTPGYDFAGVIAVK